MSDRAFAFLRTNVRMVKPRTSGITEIRGPYYSPMGRRYLEDILEAGAYMIMVESEGITENVRTWRTDVVARIIGALGLERVIFEAADPLVFAWYVKNYGPTINLFVDHSQIVQLEALRSGIWGTANLWGRVLTYAIEERHE